MTTRAQFSSLIVLLSLALTSPANCWTNGTTVEYWVRPDTMSECPHSIPQHQCVTITDLVTNSTDTSINGGMSINVFFIAGTHVPKTSGWIVVGNPYLDQKVSANFTAISDGQNQQNAIINCESGYPISFVFLQLLSLTFKKNIELQNCGFKLSFKEGYNGPQALKETTSSVVVMKIPELVIANINITSSRGAGMIIFLTDCHNSVTLNDIVIHGSNHTGNTLLRGNLYVMMFSTSENTCREPTTISITNSTFSNGIGRCLKKTSIFRCSSGGLTLSLIAGNLPEVSISINRCNFMDNEAHNGSGISLFINYTKCRRLTRIYITKSRFLRNTCTAIEYGGGTAIEYGGGIAIDAKKILVLNISETVFRYNSAKFGGAIYTSHKIIELLFDNCTFTGNEAGLGAAINSNNNNTKISNCTFIHNTCTVTTDEEREETGTIHVKDGIFLLIKDVEITGNDCRGIYLYDTELELSGTNVINGNHARQSDGGAILFQCSTSSNSTVRRRFDTSLTTLSIINNTADGYGGGIAIRICGGNEHARCFFRTYGTKISMKHNTAKRGGDAIYGAYLKNCKMFEKFDIMERNTSSAVSSPPNKVCICSDDFPQKHTCSHFMQLDTYPGQRFQVPLVCVGLYDYSSPCKVQAHLETSIADIADETILQNIDRECKQLYYSIETQQTNYTETLSLTIVKEQDSNYKWSNQIIQTVIEIRIKACPPGFKHNNNPQKCICTDYLASHATLKTSDCTKRPPCGSATIQGTLLCIKSVHSITVRATSPKSILSTSKNQQEQCDFNRSDVLCGACRPGLSLALGTSQCKECSNINLLLLIPFALAGVVLVVLLLKCNLTVSTGTINGLIFYANIVRATQTAFFLVSTDNKFVRHMFCEWTQHILSYMATIYISFVHLDNSRPANLNQPLLYQRLKMDGLKHSISSSYTLPTIVC